MEKRQRRLSRAQDAVRFVKFALFSVSAGAIQFGSSAFLLEVIRLPYWPAYLIALVLSVVYNFTINRRFTFRSATNYPKAMLKVFGYYCVFTPLSTLWGDGLTGIGWNQYIVLGGTMLINFITEFLFCRLVVYRNSMNTNRSGQGERPAAAPLRLNKTGD